MATYLNLKVRAEVQRYLQVCEDLLSAAKSPRPLTIEEMAIIRYCEMEVGKLSAPSTAK